MFINSEHAPRLVQTKSKELTTFPRSPAVFRFDGPCLLVALMNLAFYQCPFSTTYGHNHDYLMSDNQGQYDTV